MFQCTGVSEALHRILAGAGVVLSGIARFTGLLVVFCGRTKELVGALALELRKPTRDLAVPLSPNLL